MVDVTWILFSPHGRACGRTHGLLFTAPPEYASRDAQTQARTRDRSHVRTLHARTLNTDAHKNAINDASNDARKNASKGEGFHWNVVGIEFATNWHCVWVGID